MAKPSKRVGGQGSIAWRGPDELRPMLVPIDSVHHDPSNARRHPDRNIESIVASINRFGQRFPIVVQRDGMIVRAGNGRLDAMKKLGWTHVAAVVVDEPSADATAFAIADNRTSELAEWDDETLASLLQSLDKEDREVAGFNEGDLSELLDRLTPDVEIKEDEVPEPPVDPITKPGDLWLLGEHRLLCGDSTKSEDVARLMGGEKADLCFTSPPYGQQRDYTEEAKAKVADWDGLMRGVFGNLPMTDDGQVLVNLGLIHREGEWLPYWDGWIEWMRGHGWRRFGWYVWDQGSGLPGDWNGRLAPSFEFVWHFNKESKRPAKTVATKDETRARKGKSVPIGFRKEGGSVSCTSPDKIGQDFKIPDSVIRINRNPTDGRLHPATFPVALPTFAMQSWPGLAYEPFCGSGTTLIAAEQLGRKCYGMEISPQYCDVIVKRWETLTGRKAELAPR